MIVRLTLLDSNVSCEQFPRSTITSRLTYFFDPCKRQTNMVEDTNDCQSPVGLDDVIAKAVDTVPSTIAEISTSSRRKIMIVMCRSARGGKTTPLHATVRKLYAAGIHCLVVSFTVSKLQDESDSEALHRVISNEFYPALKKDTNTHL